MPLLRRNLTEGWTQMQPDQPGLSLTQKQVDQFHAHMSSKSAHVRCPFCGHAYGSYTFAFVPALLDGRPVSWRQKLVQAQCNNCGHVALFNVPLDPS